MNLLEQFREQCAKAANEAGELAIKRRNSANITTQDWLYFDGKHQASLQIEAVIRAMPLPEDEQQTRHFKNGDEIITSLYRRFKDWSKRGFSADDVTWCEVRAEVYSLINMPIPPDAEALRKDNERLRQRIAELEDESRTKHDWSMTILGEKLEIEKKIAALKGGAA